MDIPRIFVSSTYYDLKHLRSIFKVFGDQLGYDIILFEEGDILYPGTISIKEAVFNEINSSDIIVSIIGPRYGSINEESDFSFSEEEIRHSVNVGRQLIFFVEQSVLAEYQTYKKNVERAEKINWSHVDSVKVFRFIEYIYSVPKNSPIFEFQSPQDLLSKLKMQLAGLFKNLLFQRSQVIQNKQLSNLVEAIERLEKIFEIIKEREPSLDDEDENFLSNIMYSNHPAFRKIQNILKVPIRIFFENFQELKSIFDYSGFKAMDSKEIPPLKDRDNYYFWISHKGNPKTIVMISKKIFDDDGNLKFLPIKDWREEMVLEKPL